MSEFGFETTTDEVLDGIDLTGRRFVVTGASSGLGEETTRALAARGALVSMLARSRSNLEEAASRIREKVPGARLEMYEVDLADLASIRHFAEAYLADHETIDVLVNNAGVMCCPLARTADGFEMQFGTNHLGHFLLTNLLLPAIARGNSPRIVNLSSGGHSIADVDLDDPNYESSDYDPWEAYGRSKTANVLFTVELARRLSNEGILCLAVHPGAIMTQLGRHLTAETMQQMLDRTKDRQKEAGESDGGGMPFKPVEAGAATQVWAATSAELEGRGGSYLGDCQLGIEGGNPTFRGYTPYARDATRARALWELSEKLVGQTFPAA
jgi:NAD(P)-dependent dehydrogenase (short-subunit alcohol dehydrogenase family)